MGSGPAEALRGPLWGALDQARKYVAQEGREFVVDLDLEKFFDRVNHDILMSRIARRIGDQRLLIIIRRFLQAGLMQDGVCVARAEGTPQGGPMTPRTQKITWVWQAPAIAGRRRS
jgi:retron-type reverse transcriptase